MSQVNLEKVFAEVRKVRVRLESIERTLESLVDALLKKSVSFFQDILGLEKIGEWPAYAIFDIAGVTLGLKPKAKLEIYY
ncbi:MAG: hypothetical protein QMD13_08750 [Candidatus Bathyarchaeia archaeon]|nr:hypothetical protein [Candidatus Bathyarchaeia archaeon]